MLDICINRIGNDGFDKLIKSKNFPSLCDIRLSKNQISEEGAKQLMYSCNIDKISMLGLRGNNFGPRGC
jgi:Ran GTPase-activating protein (RanGAP) involved in mRNA processing and transport